jgi:hypothetical protein
MAKGRGRLSGIELLPEACSPIIDWAAAELQARDRPQVEIYSEFVARLEQLDREYRGELDLAIPSFSAFNRYSIRLAVMTRRIQDTRMIAATLAEKWDAQSSDNLTLIAAEAVKTLVFEILTTKGEAGVDPKGAMALANALRAAAQAQGISTSRRRQVEAEFQANATEAVAAAVKAKGLSAETAEDILAKILGVERAKP